MNHATITWRLFENLVQRILEANNFTLQLHYPRGDAGFDFIGNFSNERWAIEVKYYRTARAQPALIEAAANRLVKNGFDVQADKALLVVSCVVPPALRALFERQFSISVADRTDLRN